MIPKAYCDTGMPHLYHRGGGGVGVGLTLVLEFRNDGTGYAGLAARMEKVGLKLIVAE